MSKTESSVTKPQSHYTTDTIDTFHAACPTCGAALITITPTTPGPRDWGQRCKACGWRGELATMTAEDIYAEAGMSEIQIAAQLAWEAEMEERQRRGMPLWDEGE